MGSQTIDTGTDQLLCEIDESVATVTFNRPAKRNALSNELTPALRKILLALETDDAVRCVVLTGAGTAFCAGGDVGSMRDTWGENEDTSCPPIEAQIRALQHKQKTLTLRLYQHAKPTIASLPGPAAGAGFSIALACDLRIAAASAFVTAAFGRIGLSGDYGGSWFLTQLVGPARAKEIYFTSRRVGAAECLKLGIVNEVVADEDLVRRTRELARSIAQGPPIALRYMKENFNRATVADLTTCLDLEADRLMRCTQTDDHLRAIEAFLEKREPKFEGR